jgi:DNA-binding PadR family transcriptional regulator
MRGQELSSFEITILSAMRPLSSCPDSCCGSCYGYAIQKVIREQSLAPHAGLPTIYNTLGKLEDAGMIERADKMWCPAPRGKGPHTRSCYRLTEFGIQTLQYELGRLGRILKLAQ